MRRRLHEILDHLLMLLDNPKAIDKLSAGEVVRGFNRHVPGDVIAGNFVMTICLDARSAVQPRPVNLIMPRWVGEGEVQADAERLAIPSESAAGPNAKPTIVGS